MFPLLFLSLICFAFALFCFRFFKGNLLSPTMIISCLFGLSSLLSVFLLQKLSLSFSGETVAVVAGSLACLFFGEYLAKRLAERLPVAHFLSFEDAPRALSRRNGEAANPLGSNEIDFHWLIFCLLTLFSLLSFFLYLYGDYKIVKQSLGGSLPSSLTGFYSALRKAKNEGYAVESIIQHLFSASLGVALIFVFTFSYNLYHGGTFKRNAKLLLPIVIYMATTVLTSGRTAIEDFLISVCVIIYFNYHFSNQAISKKARAKTILVILLVLAFFAFSFVVLGSLRGSLFSGANQFEMLIFYFCSPLLALDQYLQSPFLNTTGLFGVHCFSGIYSALHSLLPSMVPSTSMPLEFTYFDSGAFSTNIYTAIRRYIEDFGFFSVCIISGFAFVYAFSIYRAKKNKSPLQILFLAECFYPVVEFSIEERLLNEILSLSTFFVLLYLFLFYYLLFGKLLGVKRPAPFYKGVFREE